MNALRAIVKRLRTEDHNLLYIPS